MYNLDVEKIIEEIKKEKAQKVLFQFPDGLKHHSKEVIDLVREKTGAECFIWFGDCFGACDIPINVSMKFKVDLIFQFGHNKFNKNPEGWR